MTQSPLRSRAQHDMLTRVVKDVRYAKERGIEQTAAQQMLDAHAKAGSPALPDRVKLAASNKSASPKKYNLLGAR